MSTYQMRTDALGLARLRYMSHAGTARPLKGLPRLLCAIIRCASVLGHAVLSAGAKV